MRVRPAAIGRARVALAGGARVCCRRTSAASPTGSACSSSSASCRPAGAEPPDAPGELADAVTALRLATAGAIAAGPGRLRAARLAAVRHPRRRFRSPRRSRRRGGAARSRFAGGWPRDLRERLALADDDPELGEALDRWELSLFQAEPFRSEQLRESLGALLGGADGLWAAARARAALLLGSRRAERAELLAALRDARARRGRGAAGCRCGAACLVEMLLHGDRARLVDWLDDALLGVRPRPAGYFARIAGLGPQGSAAGRVGALGTHSARSRHPRGTRRRLPSNMDEARALLERLERIEALDRAGAHPAEVLGELRGLVGEAERCTRRQTQEAGPAPPPAGGGSDTRGAPLAHR